MIRSSLLAAVLALALTPAADARPCHGTKGHAAKCAKAASSEVRSGGGGII